MVDPRIMCRQHLLGEHAEIHMFIGTISRGNSVKGYLDKNLLEVHSLCNRHDELVREMKRRNYRHYSAISKKWKQTKMIGSIDREENLEQLISRCSRCREGCKRISTNGK
ncbi:MAG: hypothetical protein JSV15_06875 [Candidatus Bathyarchaeota archaeon]|nr:MAG: hypothetical protein JSV15_06875 [Candidatus Bathyarchaeota archaeon]